MVGLVVGSILHGVRIVLCCVCFYTQSTNGNSPAGGAGRSSEVERSLVVRWVVGSILHGVRIVLCCVCFYTQSTNGNSPAGGAGRSSEVERSLMVRWVVGSILHGVDPLSYFSFQPVLHDWCNTRPWYVLSCL